MSANLCIHVIDDDEAVRASLAFMLSASGRAVRTHDSADAFLAAMDPGPGCVLTDIRMPGMSGLDLLQKLAASRPDLPVIVMTGHGDVPLAVEAMKAGAVDFIEKPFEEDRLLAALDACARRAQSGLQRDAERADALERIATLSGRERDVLLGLVAGRPNKVIAHDLGISPRTVEIYRANVMTKMRAASLSELVRMALIAGL
jgi:two-component system response regulator FixJ